MEETRCPDHPGTEAGFSCAICGRRLCTSCAVEVEGETYCRACLKEAVGRMGRSDGAEGEGVLDRAGRMERTEAPVGIPRPAGLVFLFSLLPGAGHMYMGLMQRGLQLMGLFFGTIWLASLSGPLAGFAELWGIVVAPVVWFYSFFDSLSSSGRLARGETVSDRGILAGNGAFAAGAWGWVLVAVGVLLLLGNVLYVLPPLVNLWVRRTVPALVLVALGVAILWYQKNRWGR